MIAKPCPAPSLGEIERDLALDALSFTLPVGSLLIGQLVSISPKISVSSFMGYLKGKSSLLMFDYMQILNISMVIESFGPQLLCINRRS